MIIEEIRALAKLLERDLQMPQSPERLRRRLDLRADQANELINLAENQLSAPLPNSQAKGLAFDALADRLAASSAALQGRWRAFEQFSERPVSSADDERRVSTWADSEEDDPAAFAGLYAKADFLIETLHAVAAILSNSPEERAPCPGSVDNELSPRQDTSANTKAKKSSARGRKPAGGRSGVTAKMQRLVDQVAFAGIPDYFRDAETPVQLRRLIAKTLGFSERAARADSRLVAVQIDGKPPQIPFREWADYMFHKEVNQTGLRYAIAAEKYKATSDRAPKCH